MRVHEDQSTLHEGHVRAFRSQSLDPSLLHKKTTLSSVIRNSRLDENPRNASLTKGKHVPHHPHHSPERTPNTPDSFEVIVNTPVREISARPPLRREDASQSTTSIQSAAEQPEVFWQAAARRLILKTKRGVTTPSASADCTSTQESPTSSNNTKNRTTRNGLISKAGVAVKVLSEKNGRSKIHPNLAASSVDKRGNQEELVEDQVLDPCRKDMNTPSMGHLKDPAATYAADGENECKACCSSYEEACVYPGVILRGIIIPNPVCRFKGEK